MSGPKKPVVAKTKVIIDVEHPGKSVPADTSRSIITHRPIMKDPMVVDTETPENAEAAEKPELKHSSKPKVTPTSGEKIVMPIETEKPLQLVETEKPPQLKLEKDAVTETGPMAEKEPTTKTEPESGAETKAKAETKDQAETEAEIEDEAAKQAEHEANIQKIVDSKRYFLPINSVEKRRSARFVALGIVLSLVLAVAWIDVALDAGLIHLGSVKPLTHFFSN